MGGQVKLGQPRQVFAWHNLYLSKRQIKLAKHLTFMLRGWKSCSSNGKREREGGEQESRREGEGVSERGREMIYALIVSQRVENLQLSRMRGSLLQVFFCWYFSSGFRWFSQAAHFVTRRLALFMAERGKHLQMPSSSS